MSKNPFQSVNGSSLAVSTVESILVQAGKQEKEYDWSGACASYTKALVAIPENDSSKKAEVCELLGNALCRNAMQSHNQKEFREKMHQAITSYEEADRLYIDSNERLRIAKTSRCKAVVALIEFWIAPTVPDKKRLITECWTLTKRALTVFEENKSAHEYGKTYNQLAANVDFGFFLEWDYHSRETMMREAVEYGNKAISFLAASKKPHELASAYVRTATYLEVFGVYFLGQNEREENFRKANEYWKKANELSEETAMTQLISVHGGPSWDWGEGTDKAIDNFKRALTYVTRSRDRFLIGCTMDLLAYHTCWRARATEDPDQRFDLVQLGLQYAEEAKRQYSAISFISPSAGVIWVESPYAEHYWRLAYFETNLDRKRELLKQAERNAPEMLERAEDSGIPDLLNYAHHVFSKILAYSARIEADPSVKKRLLEESLEHREEAIKIIEQLNPYHYWDLGVNQGSLANIKTDIVDLMDTPEAKKKMLQEAILNKENSINLSFKWMTLYGSDASVSLFADLGPRQYQLGELLIRLHQFTSSNEDLGKAIKAFEDAAQTYRKLNLTSRVAECCWKAAQSYDALSEHLGAAEKFAVASNNYLKAAERVPQLKNLYQDYALYMQAWSEIEKARYHHGRQEYSKAKERYEKVADLHWLTQQWSYLGPNYLAWARLEDAEDLSRKEQAENARALFRQATNLFLEAKKSIQTHLDQTESQEEQEMTRRLLRASDVRQRYCVGRIDLEEAKLLDREGDHAASSEKYGLAAQEFRNAASDGSDRQELNPIIYLCMAWQMMTRAEAESSPELYLNASKLFDKAKEHSSDEKAKTLALGHSYFCKALEAGARFEANRSRTLYSEAKKHVEVATNYYLKAGFTNASEYAIATYRLFDAYVYTYMAQTQTNAKKKAQYYQMADKLLRASASLYTKAKHPEKSEEVRRILESVSQERQLTASLAEVLHAPTITSTTTSFFTPAPTREAAAGLERFEHANIEAHLTVPAEAIVEEELEVRLDLVNVGKDFGLLIRVEDLIPQGFKVNASPSQYNTEDGSIDLKGKRLEPLKVESIKISFLTTEPSVVNLSPKVIYTDELGKFKACRPEPVSVTVHPKLAFEFKTEGANRAFDYLVKSFVEDYMKRRLPLEKSGWRTLMEIIKHGKVSRSSVYTSGGGRGASVSELERRGLVEARIFVGERGRGGKIVKMRICYEKEPVKRYIDRHT
jgi:hypothetical protein